MRVHFVTTGLGRCPTRGHDDDAGWDLYASERVEVPAHSFRDVPTSVSVELPPGVWAYLCGRSSTMRKRGLLVISSVIDNGYRGELFFGVTNLSDKTEVVEPGERLAQIIPHVMLNLDWAPVSSLTPSKRGSRGFGSTGK